MSEVNITKNYETRDVFLICTVRDATDEEKTFLDNYVTYLESQGKIVYYPPRDTNQDDPVGLEICLQNCNGMRSADEVHVYYKEKSQGSKFDFGMAFMANKPIKVVNYDELQRTPHKSFQNVLLELHERYNLS